MRRNTTLRTSVALAAVTALLGACSDSGADDDKAENAPSASPTSAEATDDTEATAETSAPAEDVDLPDGVLALPDPDAGSDSVDLDAGRYRVPLDDTLAFDVDLPEGSTAHDDGLFLATKSFVLKTELAGDEYGVPRDPCTAQDIVAVGPTVDDLVRALTRLPAYEVSRPEAVRLGGAEGTYLEARVPSSYDDATCDGGAVGLPGNPDTAVGGPAPYVGRWWVLDVDGQRVVVQQNCWGCSEEEFAQAPETPQSITFTPTT